MSEREAHIDNEEREEYQLWNEIQGRTGENKAEMLLALAEKALERPAGASDALSLAEEALATWESMGAAALELEKANAMTVIASAQSRLHRLDEAIAMVEKAIEIQRGCTSYYLDDALRKLAGYYVEQNRHEKAVPLLLESVQLNEIDGSTQWYAGDLLRLAQVYGEMEKWHSALETAERAADVGKLAKNPYQVGFAYMYKALALAELGDSQNAILFGTRALDIGRMISVSELVSRAHYVLGLAQSRSGNYEEAEAALYEAEQMIHVDLDYKFLAKIKKESIRIYRESGKTEELEIEERRLNTLLEIVG